MRHVTITPFLGQFDWLETDRVNRRYSMSAGEVADAVEALIIDDEPFTLKFVPEV